MSLGQGTPVSPIFYAVNRTSTPGLSLIQRPPPSNQLISEVGDEDLDMKDEPKLNVPL